MTDTLIKPELTQGRVIRRYAFFTKEEIERIERVMRLESAEKNEDVTWTGLIRDRVMKKLDAMERKYGIIKN